MDDERLRTLEEVAERMRVSVPTVRRWIKAGKLPATKPSGVYRVRERDFEKFVEENTGKAPAPLSQAEALEERRGREEAAAGWAELLVSDLEGFEDLLKAPAADRSSTAMSAHHLYARNYQQLLLYEEMEAAGPLSAPLLASRNRHEAAWRRIRPLMAQYQDVGMVLNGVRPVPLQGPIEQQHLRENTG